MASLAIGLVGGLVGNMLLPGIGGAIGFALGNALGNALFPAKTQGPRLTDLKLQSSEYGQMWPFCYGTVRIGGQVIWQTDLKEHKHSGGKGGGGPETYTYSASYAIGLCEGPIIGIHRIWADGRLVYDGTQSYSVWPMTIYFGTEIQLADPTMEGVLGVGNVNANRGLAYVVFKDQDLSDFFNRLPNYTFEIIASGEPRLRRISTWAVPAAPDYTGITPGSMYVAGWYLVGGVLTHSIYTEDSPMSHYQEITYDLNTGNVKTTGPVIDINNPNGASLTTWLPSLNSNVACGKERGAGTSNVAFWYVAGLSDGNPMHAPSGSGGDDFFACVTMPFSSGDFVYAAGGRLATTSSFIGKWGYNTDHTVVSGTPETEYLDLWALGYHTPTDVSLTVDDEGYMWAAIASTPARLLKINPTTMTLITDTLGPPGLIHSAGLVSSFTVFRGYILVGDSALGSLAKLYSIDGGGSFTLVATIAALPPILGIWPFVTLGGGYVITHDGILFIPAQEILAHIVADLTKRAGLDVSQFDVTELTDEVDGFVVSTQAPARNAIQPLQAAFFFDATESDAKIKYPKRGRASTATITAADLGVRQEGAALEALIVTKRMQDVELPRRVFVNFINEDTDYQKGTQIAQRLTVNSYLEWTFDLPIVMTAQKALQVANTLLYMTWYQRNGLSYSTPYKWVQSDPNDVNIVDGIELRITDRTVTLDGVVKFDAVPSLATLYDQAVPTSGGSGFVPPVPPSNQLSQLLMLDIPLIDDADFPNGPYAAMAGMQNSSWRGANLYKSTDAGASYVQELGTNIPSIIGASVGALGNFYGGNIFDETNTVDVIIGLGGGELSSQTELAVLNGANEFLLGYELIRAKSAVLIASDTYTLSGLIRGCRGTEWAMSTHVAGERFVAIPVNNVNDSFGEIGVGEKFKAVSFGQALADTAAVDFTNLGAALQCYSPVSLGGGLDASGNATLTWMRRTRIGGAWMNGTDVPLGEATEAYIVQIWDASYTICARIITASTPTADYSVADQTTDFGAAQLHIYFTVGQIGSIGLGAQAQGVIAGSGGSDNAPLNPIPPYVSSPSAPPPGPSNPVDVILAWDGSNSPYVTVGHNIGVPYVVQFTTDATPYAQTKIATSEYGDPAYLRYGVISSDTGGTAILAQQYGNTVTFLFGPSGGGEVALAPFTTYYFVIREQLPSGLPSGSIGDPANMRISY